MLRNGYPTLISLNSSGKITDEMLRVWAKILHERVDARLIILVKEDSADAAQAHMQPRVEAAGMPLERVSVLHQQSLRQFMELGHIADIALDTSPISGGTTTLHTLWMGMPVVTLDGVRGVESSTALILKGLGFGGEVTQDLESYIDATLSLMERHSHLQELRRNMREQLRSSWVMDYATRTAELEKSFRLMWLNYLRGGCKIQSYSADLQALLAETETTEI